MKRQNDTTESLVYAYHCRPPVSGWDAVLAESARMGALWDALVEIERAAERQLEEAAAADDPEVAVRLGAIGDLTARLRGTDAPTDRAAILAIVKERATIRRSLWPLLAAWRKAHNETCDRIEVARRAAVTKARQASPCWWPNYNAVIENYDRARKGVRQFGRRLRKSDAAAGGFLAVQIQRTRSGLGGAPGEIVGAGLSMLRIESAERETHVTLRVDRKGHTITLPLVLHRPLPPDVRVKSAQLIWRADPERHGARLCLTITRPFIERVPAGAGTAEIELGYWPEIGGGLTVARGSERLRLNTRWMARMDRIEHLTGVLDSVSAAPYCIKAWSRERNNLREKLPRVRREQYRLFARRLAKTYADIRLTMPLLCVVAQHERGSDENARRHRAALSSLQSELQHQCRQHGCRLTIASATVPASVDTSKTRKINRRTREQIASARKQGDDAHGISEL